MDDSQARAAAIVVAADWQTVTVSKPVFGTCLFVLGPEQILAERAIRGQVSAALREEPDAEVSHLDAAGLDAGTFNEVTGGSLFSTAQVVVIEDISALDSSLFDLIVATAITPPDNLALVLAHPGGTKGRGLVDKLKKGKVPLVEAAAIKPWKLDQFVRDEARRVRLQLDPAAEAALIQAVGPDARALASAVEQLAADLPEGRATSEQIARYFAGRAEVSSFAIADDIMAGKTGEALLKLRWALDTGVAPVLITSALAAALRGLGKYHDLRSLRMSEAELARQVGVPPFKIKQLAQQARTWGPGAIADGVRAVAEADAAIKGAAHDPAFALEQLLAKLTAARAS